MGSLQDELKKQMEHLASVSSPKAVTPPPKTVMDEQRKLAGISEEACEPKPPKESTADWRLETYAKTVITMCNELEQKLQQVATGMDQYKLTEAKEIALKPGKTLKDLKGSVKELMVKVVQARRVANGIEAELHTP